MTTDATGLFEEEKDDEGQLVLSEQGLALLEAVDTRVESRADHMVETIDQYIEHALLPSIMEDVESSANDLRSMMLLAVDMIGGQEKAIEFILHW